MKTMRAKFEITQVDRHAEHEEITMRAVGPSEGYPEDGSDENNSFAKWTPSADLKMTITNPELLGQFNPGDTYYADFSPAENKE